jgi:regulatory protein
VEEEEYTSPTDSLQAELGKQFASAMSIALRLVLRAEQSSSMLSRKLQVKGFDEVVCAAVLENLVGQSLVSDERYAASYARSRLRVKAETPRTLYAALLRRGIDRHLAARAAKEAWSEADEPELARRFIRKKLQGKDGETVKYRLRGEGFSRDVIDEVVEYKELKNRE